MPRSLLCEVATPERPAQHMGAAVTPGAIVIGRKVLCW
jgi:hypothetical protein